MLTPFAPSGPTVAISASTTSASSALTLSGGDVRVFNSTTATAFVRFTGLTSTAVTTDTPIAAGSVEVFNVGGGVGFASVILASGTGTVYFTSGRGI